MFRLTVQKTNSGESWELEGKLAGDWVVELERCWMERKSQSGISLQINLKAVTYIDAMGKKLLKEMHARGIEITGCGCMTRAVVDEVTRRADAN